jgi:lipid A 3-O-deacylase
LTGCKPHDFLPLTGVRTTVKIHRTQVFAAIAATALLCSAAASPANAADMLPAWRDYVLPASGLEEPQRFEFRLGAFAHGVAFEESGGVDVNAELVFPRVPLDIPAEWRFLLPRPHVGVMAATSSNKTSYAYTGFVWTLNLTERLFVEPIFGGAIHNGKLDNPPPDRVALGCPILFHTGISLGFRLNEQWTLYGTWDHISNANLCSRNVGLNDWGVRVGYKF